MLDPIVLVPAAFLTGLLGIGHFVYGRYCVAQNDESKQFEYRVTGRFCLILSALSLVLLVVGKLFR